jgi:hypothetical protein
MQRMDGCPYRECRTAEQIAAATFRERESETAVSLGQALARWLGPLVRMQEPEAELPEQERALEQVSVRMLVPVSVSVPVSVLAAPLGAWLPVPWLV